MTDTTAEPAAPERPPDAVDLPNGGWARLVTADEITTGRRRLVEIASAVYANALSSDDPEAEPRALMRVQDATLVALLDRWSLDRPLPTLDTIEDVPANVYDALQEAAAARGREVSEAVAGVDFSVTPDKESPTTPSGASPGASRAKTARPSTRKSRASTGSTATAA